MAARLFVEQALGDLPLGESLLLPAGAARHVQVLRLQPGHAVRLFDGSGDEWSAEVAAMGRTEVRVVLRERHQVDRELPQAVTLAVVMPANDRMDGIVEKACELGAVAVQPLMSERSVLRLNGERAEKKRLHWQGVAIAAAEQCGRSKPLQVAAVKTLSQWLAELPAVAPTEPGGNASVGLPRDASAKLRGDASAELPGDAPAGPREGAAARPRGDVDAAGGERRWLLSPHAAEPLTQRARQPGGHTLILSGPEGGLSDAEEAAARARGFHAVQLGPRILRADTAPLTVLGWLSLSQA